MGETEGEMVNKENSNHRKTESNPSVTRMDSSPLRSNQQEEEFHSPLPSPVKSPSKAIVTVDKFSRPYSPLRSPRQDQKPANSPENLNTPMDIPDKSPSQVVVFNRSVKDEPATVTKVDRGADGPGIEDGGGGERRSRAVSSIVRRSKRDVMLKRAALGFRVSELVFCLISFSVMAADKTQGWSGDSFDRYKEYRYCLSVTVIAFVYSGFQACDLAHNLITGKHVIRHHSRYNFDFIMDQILAYLLISASSSAATRVDDWQSNWGKDEFTEMASASVGMSFLAFAAFAFSSLISGYNLCTHSYR